jgi:hypothetical protein
VSAEGASAETFFDLAPKLPKPHSFHPTPAGRIEVKKTFEELVEKRIKACIEDIAQQACKAVREGLWRPDLAVRGMQEFLRSVAGEAYSDAEHLSPSSFPLFFRELERQITTSDEWLGCLEVLAKKAPESESSSASRGSCPVGGMENTELAEGTMTKQPSTAASPKQENSELSKGSSPDPISLNDLRFLLSGILRTASQKKRSEAIATLAEDLDKNLPHDEIIVKFLQKHFDARVIPLVAKVDDAATVQPLVEALDKALGEFIEESREYLESAAQAIGVTADQLQVKLHKRLTAQAERWKARACGFALDAEFERATTLVTTLTAALNSDPEAVESVMAGARTSPTKPGGTEPARGHPAKVANGATGTGASWQAIEISFLSHFRVQIHNGTNTETHNYGELGFADRRAKQGKPKPNQAWVTLRVMAEQNGIIQDGAKTGATWPKVEKRIQEIRKVLRRHFSITADPIPFVEGTGYQARFKIGCSVSVRGNHID